MLPDKAIRCHRTGFQETCFKCVTEHGCRLWKLLRVSADRESGQVLTELYDCADAHAHTLMVNMLGRQDTTSASVDALRKEVVQANDVGMASSLAGINAQMRRLTDEGQMALPFQSQKLIGSAPAPSSGDN